MEQTTIITESDQPPAIWNWVDVLLITLSSAFFILLGAWGLGLVFQPQVNMQTGLPLVYTASLTAMEAIGLIISVTIFGIWRKKLTWKDIGFTRINLSWIIWAGITAVIFIPVIGLVALAIQIALGLPLENPQLEFLIPRDFNWYGVLGMVIFGGILVPIAEEIYFRGVLYRWMNQTLATWIAIILSSLIFGLLHGDVAVAGATFVMGIILAWFFERSGSLWTSTTIHIVNNASKLLLLYVLLAFGIEFPTIV